MSRLTGFLPVAQGVAAYAALCREADRLRAAGDPRSRDQIMADTLVRAGHRAGRRRRRPGRGAPGDDRGRPCSAAATSRPTWSAAARSRRRPARDLVRDPAATAWLRRLYTRPADGTLVAMDSQRRDFPAPLRRLIVVRDQVCRTPWCGAPVRHADHVMAWADGGADQRGQRARTVRGLQLRQTSPRLARPTRTRRRRRPGARPPPPPGTPTRAGHHPCRAPGDRRSRHTPTAAGRST